ncbi:MAG: hypothetical protein JJE51_01355 [Thermoanaerobaculia bacterium]|nr:hypothetical protein [Thermoanaerobaculia bacterium]
MILLALLFAFPLFAQQPALTINNDQPIFTAAVPFMITGAATPGARVNVSVENGGDGSTIVEASGTWALMWTAPLRTGVYNVTATSDGATATQILRVQIRGLLPRQPQLPNEPRRMDAQDFETGVNQEVTDRWRITPPAYELDEQIQGRRIGTRGATLDPYNKNLLKGDFPIFGKDWFLVLTGISDTLVESRTLPTPSGVSGAQPDNFPFFGSDDQGLFNQNFIISADLFQGNTAFQPVNQRVKATVIANFNHVRVEENGVVKPDVRRGTRRSDGQFALQELFYEKRLVDLTSNYDFLSVRIGSQPFLSDFRGFIFSDTNLGIRFFGDYKNNRYQYNLAFFDRLEKDTNSGLNRYDTFRDQQVIVANFFWQDFIWKGFTQQFSVHHVKDEATFEFDRNGVLVRPAPVGSFTPHEIEATYVGVAGLGHRERLNIDYALYYVFGTDSENPIAGPDPLLRDGPEVDISAGLGAFELSYDKDWLRPRFALFYSSGDRKPRDREATGFDAIFDNLNFAGGGFSFFNRLGIRLAGSGVALVERGSLIPSLRSSKDEGQPQYVNPGLQLASLGLDVEVTPRLKALFTGNYIRLDTTAPIEAILFQGDIRNDIGFDLSAGLRYRPFITNNVILSGGAAVLVPGGGWEDIYENKDPLYHLFTQVTLQF